MVASNIRDTRYRALHLVATMAQLSMDDFGLQQVQAMLMLVPTSKLVACNASPF